MGTGRRIEDSEGGVHKSWDDAVRALVTSPWLTFAETWLTMGGRHERDVTEEVYRRYRERGFHGGVRGGQ